MTEIVEWVGLIGLIGLIGVSIVLVVRADWGVRGVRGCKKLGRCSAPGTDIDEGISPSTGVGHRSSLTHDTGRVCSSTKNISQGLEGYCCLLTIEIVIDEIRSIRFYGQAEGCGSVCETIDNGADSICRAVRHHRSEALYGIPREMTTVRPRSGRLVAIHQIVRVLARQCR